MSRGSNFGENAVAKAGRNEDLTEPEVGVKDEDRGLGMGDKSNDWASGEVVS
jgi:hypothetical protein